MILIDRRRVRAMSDSELRAECRRLSQEWHMKGMPDEEDMPRVMLATLLVLREERQRRGEQLYLF